MAPRLTFARSAMETVVVAAYPLMCRQVIAASISRRRVSALRWAFERRGRGDCELVADDDCVTTSPRILAELVCQETRPPVLNQGLAGRAPVSFWERPESFPNVIALALSSTRCMRARFLGEGVNDRDAGQSERQQERRLQRHHNQRARADGDQRPHGCAQAQRRHRGYQTGP